MYILHYATILQQLATVADNCQRDYGGFVSKRSYTVEFESLRIHSNFLSFCIKGKILNYSQTFKCHCNLSTFLGF